MFVIPVWNWYNIPVKTNQGWLYQLENGPFACLLPWIYAEDYNSDRQKKPAQGHFTLGTPDVPQAVRLRLLMFALRTNNVAIAGLLTKVRSINVLVTGTFPLGLA